MASNAVQLQPKICDTDNWMTLHWNMQTGIIIAHSKWPQQSTNSQNGPICLQIHRMALSVHKSVYKFTEGTNLSTNLQNGPIYLQIHRMNQSVNSQKRPICLLGDSGGVVNSLDFCPASLKSLGCFYFWYILSSQTGSDSEFANFTLPTVKAFFEARSHNVSGNKQ